MDRNRHLLFMRKLLLEFFRDPLLSSELKFKGGTAAMFFYGLPRFSTDLDFNLANGSSQLAVYERIMEFVSRSGKIVDSANKRFGPIVVLDYGSGERNLKVEVSNRIYDNHYSLQSFGSAFIPVLERPDMLSHKLCAMLERKAPRDVFDVWYFVSRMWELNENIIKERTGLETRVFLERCLLCLDKVSPAAIMVEVGELLDDSMKPFVRGRLLDDLRESLQGYVQFLPVSSMNMQKHTELLFADGRLLPALRKADVDASTVSESKLSDILSGKKVELRSKKGVTVSIQKTGGGFQWR